MAGTSAVLLAAAWAQVVTGSGNENKIVGAWEMVSYDYGSNGTLPKGSKEIKLLSAHRFVWVLYNGKSGQTLATGGGTYSLVGDSYAEHLDFSDKRAAALIGKEQQFTLTTTGDTLKTVGTLSTGEKIAEVWKRLD